MSPWVADPVTLNPMGKQCVSPVCVFCQWHCGTQPVCLSSTVCLSATVSLHRLGSFACRVCCIPAIWAGVFTVQHSFFLSDSASCSHCW